MPKGTTYKNKMRMGKILEGLVAGKNLTTIGKELVTEDKPDGLSHRQVNNIMRRPEFKELLGELSVHLDRLYGKIYEFYASDDPNDKREALRQDASIVKAIIPRFIFQKSESTNYHVDVKIVELQRLVESLPYEARCKWLEDTESEEDVPRKIEVTEQR